MATLIKVDRNGTKYWTDDTCQRCGGSGRSRVRIEKEYTPEYMEKLMARRAARAEKKIERSTGTRR